MEMKYTVNPDYTISNVEFAGLTGDEHVFSVKESLAYLTIENPGHAFATAVKAGATNELDDDEYEQVLASIKCVIGLFRYDETDKDSLSEMNVLMLLKNAITELVKKDVELRKLQKNKKSTKATKNGGKQ